MRGRGSKRCPQRRRHAAMSVAPHAGAWIETISAARQCGGGLVAPHAGAWIETSPSMSRVSRIGSSPPMRGRGSKLSTIVVFPESMGRPPCGGVDRNSSSAAPCHTAGRPPCGGVDRNYLLQRLGGNRWSPPMRGRGSKPTRHRNLATDRVAPHAGAWIETSHASPTRRGARSPPMRGRGSKHAADHLTGSSPGRPPCGGVDRNSSAPHRRTAPRRPPCGGVDRNRRSSSSVPAASRPPCGGVDRNARVPADACGRQVAPHAGAWIETSRFAAAAKQSRSPSMRGRGSKRAFCRDSTDSAAVALHAGAWIETSRG